MGDHVKSFVSGIECSCCITFPTLQEQIHISNNRKKCWSFFILFFIILAFYISFIYIINIIIITV